MWEAMKKTDSQKIIPSDVVFQDLLKKYGKLGALIS